MGIRIGLIGYGYWGTNLLRNFMRQKECTVTYVADPRAGRLQIVNEMFPNIKTTQSADTLIESNEVDAVIIATPVFTHFQLAKKAIENGKHILIEKPITGSVKEAEFLMNEAFKKGLVLMVDHTYLYTSAVHKMKELIQDDVVGNLQYFDSSRINLGLFQPDINVLWDLAPHDISILNYLVDEKPMSVNATGISHTSNDIENIAYMTVNYQSDFIAHFNCSWTSPVKVRQTLIGGDKKMIVYNDLEVTEKVKIYDTGFNHQTDEEKEGILVDYRTGDIFIPKLSEQEALFSVAKDFVDSIVSNKSPLSSAQVGLEVVQILEAAQESIKNNGKEVLLKG
jgi:Predicted dehydrogenases and related proteins